MSFEKRKAVAKVILLLYAFVISTFSLDHKDFVPIGGRLFISPFNTVGRSIDSNGDNFVCPAHNFAQSAHGPVAASHVFSSQKDFSFLHVVEYDEYVAAPARNFSTRAPPEA